MSGPQEGHWCPIKFGGFWGQKPRPGPSTEEVRGRTVCTMTLGSSQMSPPCVLRARGPQPLTSWKVPALRIPAVCMPTVPSVPTALVHAGCPALLVNQAEGAKGRGLVLGRHPQGLAPRVSSLVGTPCSLSPPLQPPGTEPSSLPPLAPLSRPPLAPPLMSLMGRHPHLALQVGYVPVPRPLHHLSPGQLQYPIP